MTSFDRFERSLPELFDELASPRVPDYFDELLTRTAATRQRPVWAIPERWLSMSAISRRFAVAPRIPWRLGVAVALLIVAALIAALVVGSGLSRTPAPFGPAANGAIPYVSEGDIYIGDPITGVTRLLDASPTEDGMPMFSPDGTRVFFARLAAGVSPPALELYVVNPDGSNLTLITPTPIPDEDWHQFAWTPDSRHIAVVLADGGVDQLHLYDATRQAPPEPVRADGISNLTFRPPDGREILFRAAVPGSEGESTYGLFVMNADGTNRRQVAEPNVQSDSLDLTGATYSPDGSRIFFNRWTSDASAGSEGCCQLYVMNADGTDEHEFIPNPGTAWDGQAIVSPDGTRIAFWHNVNDGGDHGVFVISADGSGPLIETGPPIAGTAHYIWSPDSAKILMYPDVGARRPAYLLDPAGGPWTTVQWQQDGDIDWQRLAP